METAASVESTLVEPRREAAHPCAPFTPLEQAIVLAVAYADVFDFPLTHDELVARIVRSAADRRRVMRCLRRMDGDVLHDTGAYVCLRGREEILELRSDRMRRADPVWDAARRFARWFRFVPFMRSVAVSGSLAVGNVNRTSDVDFFCITAANRLWISRLFLVPLSKATRYLPKLFRFYLCPNYLVDEASLAVADRNLFTAHEVTQAVPLWGGQVHAKFVRSNSWAASLLPNGRSEGTCSKEVEDRSRPPLLTRLIEKCLGGRMGDRFNAALHALFVYGYALRARRRGWPWAQLAPAYQLGRYTVPEGGYTAIVADLFRRRVRAAAGDRISKDEIDALFPRCGQSQTVYDWRALFEQEYGPGS